MESNVLALILAAGEGKRMQSRGPKVMQPLAGKPVLRHILDTLSVIDDLQPVVIHGHCGEVIQSALAADYKNLLWVKQAEQLGTGHAVQQAYDYLDQAEIVLVLLGDVPLIRKDTIRLLCQRAAQSGFALLSAKVENPHGYGRIVRDHDGSVLRIVGEKDANEHERAINEINSGVMAFSSQLLKKYLPLLDNGNAQGEYYLTDLVGLCVEENQPVIAEVVSDAEEVMGINNRRQLAAAEKVIRTRRAGALLDAGVTLIDPDRIDIQGNVVVGKDVVIEANVVFKGDVRLGDGVIIESSCVLIDCAIGDESQILSHSRIEGSDLGANVTVGPFARIRPGTSLADNCKVGNFVETKAAEIGAGSKVNHLSYIGDAKVGARVNIGAGTITCNYDGVNKHQTIIDDEVFVGSNTALVAPIHLGEGATVGAGSTLSKDVTARSLALTRAKCKEIKDWDKK